MQHYYCTDSTLRFRKTREIPSANMRKPKYLIELGNRDYIDARGDAATRFATSNARASWPVRVYKALPPAQATMPDPIQMGLRTILLGCSRFTIEHRSYQFVRLQGTIVVQIFLFVFTIEHWRHQFVRLLSTVEHRPTQAQLSERDYARAVRPRLLPESLAGLRMSTLCSYILNVIILCGPSSQSITYHMHKTTIHQKTPSKIERLPALHGCLMALEPIYIYIYIYIYI